MRFVLFTLIGVLSGAPTATAADRLALNSATVEQLAALDGVDPSVAAAVVELRTRRGRIDSVEALRVIPDIPDASLDALRRGTSIDVPVLEAQTKTYDSVEAVLGEFATEPTVRQTQSWASDYAKTNPLMVERFMRASKTFGALPEVTLEYQLGDDWDQGFDYRTVDGSELALPSDEPFAVLSDAGVDQDVTYKVKAKWELDKIVMSSERIRVLGEAQDIAKLRDKVLIEVTELYFERRRLQVEQLLNPGRDLSRRVKDQLELMELTASLDAYTGGAFSTALAR